MTPEERAAWDAALDRLSRRDYAHDPAAWVRDRLGGHLWSKQAEIAQAVCDHRLVAVQSSHGVGKSIVAAKLAAWFIDTRPQDDRTMVITSAPTAHQVSAVLWRYIRSDAARGNLAGYITQGAVPEWKIDGGLIGFGRRPADHSKSSFQGFHAEHMLVILDEAGGIPKWLWEAVDSLLTGEDDQHALVIGNPDDNSSHFHQVCTTEPNWHRIKINAFDTPDYTGEQIPEQHRAAFRTISGRTYVEDKIQRWGEHSALFKVKVLGEFVDSEDGLVPLSWCRAAVARWHAWDEAGRPEIGRRIIGVDVARYGEDSTVLAIREGDVIRELKIHHKIETMQVAALVEAELDWPMAYSVVDVIGIGAGVVDVLRHRRRRVRAFNAAMATKRRDSTAQWKFANVRSAAYYNIRELLDPALGATLALPDDDDLIAELTAPAISYGTGGIIKVESKDDIRKRLGRSTDRADAVAMALWVNSADGRMERDADDRPKLRPRAAVVPYADAVQWT